MLKDFCKKKDIKFLSTPYDVESARFLNEDLEVEMFKSASADLVDLSLHDYIASTGKPSIISVGMANLGEIEENLKIYNSYNHKDIILLHCVSNYPCAHENLNLRVLETLKQAFDLPVGYSDHSIGCEAAILSIGLGAKIIEKHFTLDRSLPGPDHSASMEPAELGRMIIRLREVSTSLGDGDKKPSLEEANTAALVRRSWHSTRALPKGHTIVWGDVTLKRPADGLPPGQTPLGKKLKRRLGADEPVRLADFS